MGLLVHFDANTPMDWAPNLHSTWDEYMVNELMAGARPMMFAKRLTKESRPEQIQYCSKDDPLRWATESYWLARKKAYYWTNGEKLPWT